MVKSVIYLKEHYQHNKLEWFSMRQLLEMTQEFSNNRSKIRQNIHTYIALFVARIKKRQKICFSNNMEQIQTKCGHSDLHSIGPTQQLLGNRHHRSCGDHLEGKGENYQVCSVQYCVQQLCTVRCTHI